MMKTRARPPVMLAAVVAFAFIVSGCRSDVALESPGGSAELPASTASPTPTMGPSSSAPPVPTAGMPIATLDDLLPEQLAGSRWSRQFVGPNALIGDVYSPDLGDRLAAASGRISDELTIATAVAAPDDGSKGIGPVTIIAIHLAESDAMRMVGAHLAGWFAASDRGPWTVRTDSTPSFESDEERTHIQIAWFTLYPADETLYIIALGEEEPTDAESWYRSYETPPDELVKEIIAGLPLRTIPSHPISEPEVIVGATPLPSSTGTPPADMALEARMPAEIDGHPMQIGSIDGLDTSEPSFLNFAAHQLVEHYGLDGEGASAAYATSEELSSYVLMASTIEDKTGEELKGAFLSEIFSEGGARFDTSSGHVEDTTYLLNEVWALFAVDEVLFMGIYLDIGDCFEDCDTGPRPPLEDLVRASIEALP